MSGAPIGVSSELAVVRPPGVGGLDDPPQPQPKRLLLHSGDLRATALDLEFGDAPGPQSITHRARVIAPVEMQGPDLVEQPCASMVGSSMATSLRLAPSIAQLTGMP